MPERQVPSHQMNYGFNQQSIFRGLGANVREVLREASARLDGLDYDKFLDHLFALYVGANDVIYKAKKALKAI